MNVYIVPYNINSESAKALANMLGARLSSGQKRFIKDKSLIINWGNSDSSLLDNVLVRRSNKIINLPSSIDVASDKVKTFNMFNLYNVPTVEWTTNRSIAINWLDEFGYVYARLLSRSSQGRGIKIITMEDVMPYAELYTKAIPKAHEYRVHVFKNKIIDFTKKKKRNDVIVNPYIKNFDNGWVFCREGIQLPTTVKDAAIKACQALRLDFCALDILYKERENKVYVLEANTAPGLEGTTLNKYYECFKQEIEWNRL